MDRFAPLRARTIALVGLMGVGKSSVGRRLANALDLPFRDADVEVEQAAGRSIPEIFAEIGEAGFREGERRVIARLLEEPPHVLATGGGAFMNPQTRALLKAKAITVWLKADLEVLARRISRKDNRPLLKGKNQRKVLAELAREQGLKAFPKRSVRGALTAAAGYENARVVICGALHLAGHVLAENGTPPR